jgi:hypothetical protein
MIKKCGTWISAVSPHLPSPSARGGRAAAVRSQVHARVSLVLAAGMRCTRKRPCGNCGRMSKYETCNKAKKSKRALAEMLVGLEAYRSSASGTRGIVSAAGRARRLLLPRVASRKRSRSWAQMRGVSVPKSAARGAGRSSMSGCELAVHVSMRSSKACAVQWAVRYGTSAMT